MSVMTAFRLTNIRLSHTQFCTGRFTLAMYVGNCEYKCFFLQLYYVDYDILSSRVTLGSSVYEGGTCKLPKRLYSKFPGLCEPRPEHE